MGHDIERSSHVTNTPRSITVLVGGGHLVRLTLNTWVAEVSQSTLLAKIKLTEVHDMVPTDSTVVHNDICQEAFSARRPQGMGID